MANFNYSDYQENTRQILEAAYAERPSITREEMVRLNERHSLINRVKHYFSNRPSHLAKMRQAFTKAVQPFAEAFDMVQPEVQTTAGTIDNMNNDDIAVPNVTSYEETFSHTPNVADSQPTFSNGSHEARESPQSAQINANDASLDNMVPPPPSEEENTQPPAPRQDVNPNMNSLDNMAPPESEEPESNEGTYDSDTQTSKQEEPRYVGMIRSNGESLRLPVNDAARQEIFDNPGKFTEHEQLAAKDDKLFNQMKTAAIKDGRGKPLDEVFGRHGGGYTKAKNDVFGRRLDDDQSQPNNTPENDPNMNSLDNMVPPEPEEPESNEGTYDSDKQTSKQEEPRYVGMIRSNGESLRLPVNDAARQEIFDNPGKFTEHEQLAAKDDKLFNQMKTAAIKDGRGKPLDEVFGRHGGGYTKAKNDVFGRRLDDDQSKPDNTPEKQVSENPGNQTSEKSKNVDPNLASLDGLVPPDEEPDSESVDNTQVVNSSKPSSSAPKTTTKPQTASLSNPELHDPKHTEVEQAKQNETTNSNQQPQGFHQGNPETPQTIREKNLQNPVVQHNHELVAQKQREQQKDLQREAMRVANNESHLGAFFDRLRHDPKGLIKDANAFIHKSVDKIKHLPDHVQDIREKATAKMANVLQDGADKLKKQQKIYQAKHIELNHPNIQGLELVRDNDNPDGFRFKATKAISIPVDSADRNGKPKYLHLEKGQTTGMIIPKGRKNKEALAEYSHGNKFIKFAVDHDSTVTMNSNLQDRDIFGKSIGEISNSDITLSGKTQLDQGNVIHDSIDVNVADQLSQTKIINSRNVELNAPVTKSFINHSNDISTTAPIAHSSIDSSSLSNSGTGTINNSAIAFSKVALSNDETIANSAVAHATVLNTSVIGFEDGEMSKIKNGLYQNSTIGSSEITMSDGSRIANSTINKTQIVTDGQNNSMTSITGSDLDNVTMSTMGNDIQALSDVNLDHAMVNGDVALENSEISSNAQRPNYIRNLSAHHLIVDTNNKSIALADMMNLNGKGMELGDNNIPQELEPDYDSVSYRYMQDHTGYSHKQPAESRVQNVPTKYGIMRPTDQIHLIGRKIKAETRAIRAKLNKVFDIRQPETSQTKVQDQNMDDEISA